MDTSTFSQQLAIPQLHERPKRSEDGGRVASQRCSFFAMTSANRRERSSAAHGMTQSHFVHSGPKVQKPRFSDAHEATGAGARDKYSL